jgi:hypothetical protein
MGKEKERKSAAQNKNGAASPLTPLPDFRPGNLNDFAEFTAVLPVPQNLAIVRFDFQVSKRIVSPNYPAAGMAALNGSHYTALFALNAIYESEKLLAFLFTFDSGNVGFGQKSSFKHSDSETVLGLHVHAILFGLFDFFRYLFNAFAD